MESERNGRRNKLSAFSKPGEKRSGRLGATSRNYQVAVDAVDNTGAEELIIRVEKVLTQGDKEAEGEEGVAS